MSMNSMRTEYDRFQRTAPEAAASGMNWETYSHRYKVSPSYRLRYGDLLQRHLVMEETKRREAAEAEERSRLEREIAFHMGI